MARKKAKKGKAKGPHKEILDGDLVKALAHPLRARTLAILNERIASPMEISRQLDKPVGNVSYHINRLLEFGCVALVSTRRVRGATEHFYRGVTRSFLNAENWAKLSSEAKGGISVAGLKMQNDASLLAIQAGTFDAREDRHLSCTPVNVDEEGWQETTELLAETLERVLDIQARSIARQAKEGNPSFRATISILGFESPPPEPEEEAK